MDSSPRKARDVFLAVINLPAHEREAYLREACEGHADLHQRVLALLQAQAEIGSFYEMPSHTVDQPIAESSGTIIGPYKLIEQIGEGGMGAVWMAQQTEPVKRVVALKLIKAGMDSRQVIARFEAERQALALMDHANIARVLDAGTTTGGRPYFVMDLVKGVPITKYCDERHLTPRERLELFIPICQAVQHAHQKGIIHRDLKPSNVLVALYDGKPVPKVIDFGVAKAAGQPLTDKSLVTGFGNIVGTLEYMSPEQAELNQLDIDTRSDIYSLGVLLYELLAGSPPFSRKDLEQAGMLEMLRVIREQEPSKPSTKLSTAEGLPALAANRGTEPAKLTKLVRGELDWIVMKALEKNRNRRYETANGFAMDVQRYLADEPVQACPPTMVYRLRKLVRRNKGPAVAASLILLALLTAVVSMAVGLVAVEHERARTAQERDEKSKALAAETKAREGEKQARDKAMNVLRAMTDEIVENQMARDTQLTEENKEFLRKIIKHYEGFAAITGDDAESRSIRAEGLARVGLMRYRLGELKDAETAYADALAIQKQLVADFPTRPEFRASLAATHTVLGTLLKQTGRLNEAKTAYADALAIRKQLAADFPTRPNLRMELARSHSNLATLLEVTGWFKEAKTAYADALAIQKQLAADFPTRPEFRESLSASHNNLGILHEGTGRPKDAEAAYAAAVAIQKQLVADFPTRPNYRKSLANSHLNRGRLLQVTGQLKEAETAYADALTILTQLAADFPTRPEFRASLAGCHDNLGIVLDLTGRLNEAETAYANALAIKKQLAADFPNQPDMRNNVAATLVNLANHCNMRREFQAAKAYLEEALPHHQAALMVNPRQWEYRWYFRNNRRVLVWASAGLHDESAAVQAAQKLRDLGWDASADAYCAGCTLAICIRVVEEDDQLNAAECQAAVQFYGDRAMDMLCDAVGKGYRNAAHMKQDKDLDPLRHRDDFKKLLAELEKK